MNARSDSDTVNLEIGKLWDLNPLVVLDANVLLNLYRYSPSTMQQVIEHLKEVSECLWIPHQVLLEYERNRESAQKDAYGKYKQAPTAIRRIVEKARADLSKQFNNARTFRYPNHQELERSVEEQLLAIDQIIASFDSRMADEAAKNELMLQERPVDEFLILLKNREAVGKPLTMKERLGILLEGELRYKYKIPPGYMDEDKNGQDKFGDLVLWKQILTKASFHNGPVIFITGDLKEDWWAKGASGPVPRCELVQEFGEYSVHRFFMSQLDSLINFLGWRNDIQDRKFLLEINASAICYDLIYHDWSTIVAESQQLTSYLIHDGELQERLGIILTDAEVLDIHLSEIIIEYVHVHTDNVSMGGSFTSIAQIAVVEYVGRHYSTTHELSIEVSGSARVDFKVDFTLEDYILIDTVQVTLGNFGIELDDYYLVGEEPYICDKCSSGYGQYTTSSGDRVCATCATDYEICPECSKFYKAIGVPAAFCSTCTAKN